MSLAIPQDLLPPATYDLCLYGPPPFMKSLFRGFLYGVLKRYSDRFFAAVATSMAFAVVHQNVLTLAPLFVLAMCFTLAYELTGCLWVPIVMHALFNGGQVALILSNPNAF